MKEVYSNRYLWFVVKGLNNLYWYLYFQKIGSCFQMIYTISLEFDIAI